MKRIAILLTAITLLVTTMTVLAQGNVAQSGNRAVCTDVTFPIDGQQANAGAGTGSAATGTGTFSLDTTNNVMTWTISYDGDQLKNGADSVTAAHFHGPAAAGANGGVQVNIGTSNPVSGTTSLSEAQKNDVLNSLWYVNIHTSADGGGEIRGQVTGCSVVPEMVIRGVLDGPLPSGRPKVIELQATADIENLSLYGVGSANNGGGTDGQEFTFPAGSLAAGESVFIAPAESTPNEFSDWFGFTQTYTSSVALINGDDAIELFMNGEVIDVFGDINVDGNGEQWEYLDGWACRLAETGPDGSTFNIGNWRFSGPNALDDETTNASAETPYPVLPTPCSGIVPTAVSLSSTDTALTIIPAITIAGMLLSILSISVVQRERR